MYVCMYVYIYIYILIVCKTFRTYMRTYIYIYIYLFIYLYYVMVYKCSVQGTMQKYCYTEYICRFRELCKISILQKRYTAYDVAYST